MAKLADHKYRGFHVTKIATTWSAYMDSRTAGVSGLFAVVQRCNRFPSAKKAHEAIDQFHAAMAALREENGS